VDMSGHETVLHSFTAAGGSPGLHRLIGL